MKYYQFSERGFSNEYQLVGCTSNKIFNKLSDKFYNDNSINAKIWNVKAKTLTKKDKAFMSIDTYDITADEVYQMSVNYANRF